MTALTTPRRGEAVARVAYENYAAYYVGFYRGARNGWLLMARCTDDTGLRQQRIQFAMNEHRGMMRCLREYRRDQREQVAA